ncbi:MAG: SurA N-terminal domain-containing protein [Terricaulis sp.]|nr:SurA N-terminal domain-containing protein [Terricaulis sp.]
MILQFRKFSKSIFAAVILGLVGLAMVLWLPSGQFSAITSNDIAKVGNYTVSPFQLTRELQRNLRMRREQTGQSITQQEAIDAGMHSQILDQLISRLSFYAYADKIGVSASDRQVAEAIREIPQVLNPVTGQFDATSYNAFLRQIEYSQPEFEAVARGDMTQQMLIEALLAGARSPTSYGALMLTYQTESRVISLAALPASSVGRIDPPNEEQLQAFYAENAANLRLPEFRVLTFVIARPEDFLSRVTVSEEDLAAEVEARRQSIAQPERRSYVRITAQNEQQATEISQRLGRGGKPGRNRRRARRAKPNWRKPNPRRGARRRRRGSCVHHPCGRAGARCTRPLGPVRGGSGGIGSSRPAC